MRLLLLLLSGIAGLIALLRRPWRFEPRDDPGDDWVPPPPRGRAWLKGPRGSGNQESKIIGRAGDTISVHGHVLDVPAGAVEGDATFRFTLREAKTPEVMVNVTANSVGGAGKFRGRVNLLMSYRRVPDQNIPPGKKLDAWRYRKKKGENSLQPVPGVDDREAKTIRITGTGISRFVVAT